MALRTNSNIEQLGRTLFKDYVFAFEVTALLLTIAVVGAVLLARKPKGELAPLPDSVMETAAKEEAAVAEAKAAEEAAAAEAKAAEEAAAAEAAAAEAEAMEEA